MDNENKETILRQLTEAIGNRKYFLISAAVSTSSIIAPTPASVLKYTGLKSTESSFVTTKNDN